MTQKGEYSGKCALKYCPVTRIQVLASFQIPFPNWSVSRFRNIPKVHFRAHVCKEQGHHCCPLSRHGYLPGVTCASGTHTWYLNIFIKSQVLISFFSVFIRSQTPRIQESNHPNLSALFTTWCDTSHSTTHTCCPLFSANTSVHFLIFSKQIPMWKIPTRSLTL